MLMQPEGITHAMRLMNQTSVLGRYLWVFRRIVGQMQHDLFHVYTVDQHILMVLRNVRRFFMAEHAHEYPFCSQLAAGWDKPYILYTAALFHDIAKGRGGDHSELGAREVRRFCQPARHRARGLQADRVPGEGTPGHEPRGAEGGPGRPGRDRRRLPSAWATSAT
jgi:UTP:GlnB (protein PII) uridylyltransferase